MQSLVMSALAMATLMKSSEIELGSRGRELALTLRDQARACLEHACNTRTPDYQMAGAALVRTLSCSLIRSVVTNWPFVHRSLRYSRLLATLSTRLRRRAARCSSSIASSTSCRSAPWTGTILMPAALRPVRSPSYTCLTGTVVRSGVPASSTLRPLALRHSRTTSRTRPRMLLGIPTGSMWTSARRSVVAFVGVR